MQDTAITKRFVCSVAAAMLFPVVSVADSDSNYFDETKAVTLFAFAADLGCFQGGQFKDRHADK